jgi:hypothetical protein
MLIGNNENPSNQVRNLRPREYDQRTKSRNAVG